MNDKEDNNELKFCWKSLIIYHQIVLAMKKAAKKWGGGLR
jgi:hypothetical protein